MFFSGDDEEAFTLCYASHSLDETQTHPSTEDRHTKNYGTNVATMAKIIIAGEKQKMLRKNAMEISCEVDIETSEDGDNENTLLLQST